MLFEMNVLEKCFSIFWWWKEKIFGEKNWKFFEEKNQQKQQNKQKKINKNTLWIQWNVKIKSERLKEINIQKQSWERVMEYE